MNDYPNEQQFDRESFWEKIKRYALIAGKQLIEKALTLYYCLIDSDTPFWAKTVIMSALSYFVIPIDAIPDFASGVGYSDDLVGLTSAFVAVAAHIKPEHKEKAQTQLKFWFGESIE